jgi:paraquat-inducible protein B
MSWIWLVPIVATLAAGSLVLRTWFESGPQITISFESAEGLQVGQTQLRYKEVAIGTVSGITLSEDRRKVIVRADIDKNAASLAQDDTSFWVVRPRLGFTGVSGLGTLLSGAYIGVDAPEGEPKTLGPTKTAFVGLESPPEVTYDRPGRRYALRADSLGSLDVGSPIYYRQIQVGRVIGFGLDESGERVNVQIFVDSPNDRFVRVDTRFWNASGVDFTVNAEGLKLRTQSLISVALGGIAFDTVDTSTPQAEADRSFRLFDTETAAKAPFDHESHTIRMRFDQSVRGLVPGAPIDFNGVTLGEVNTVALDFDRDRRRFFAAVEATVYPSRLGLDYERIIENTPSQANGVDPGPVLMKTMVARGLRAQLRTSNLLTGQMYIVLAMYPNAKPVQFDESADLVFIPSIPGSLDQLQQQISNIVDKIDKIPFDRIGRDLSATLESMHHLMVSLEKDIGPQTHKVLTEARKSFNELNHLVSPDGALPINAERSMQELSRAARSLRNLADYLQTNPDALLRGRSVDVIPGVGPVRN